MLRCITGGWHVCDPAWSRGWRHEPYSKLYAVRDGTAFYDCGAGERPLRAGQLYLIPGERPHRFRCARRMTVWWLHFTPEDLRLGVQLAALGDLRSWPQRAHPPAWQRLADYGAERPWTTTLAISGLVLGLCAELPVPPARPAERLAPLAAWLAEHALRNPSLAEIAHQAGMSPSQVTRLARREWGEAPHARVLRLRLTNARELLAGSDLTVAAIARRCSFADAPSLSKAFRAWCGEPPDTYRRGLAP